jgi:hypothetical protein
MHREIVTGALAGDELLVFDRPAWAWEFLRRNPEYSALAPSPLRKTRVGQTALSVIEANDCADDQQRWGLCCIEGPEHLAEKANLFWQAEADPRVLVVGARRCLTANDDVNRIDFASMLAEVTVLKLASGAEHVLIRTGPHSVQLSLNEGTVLQGPVSLNFQISGLQYTPLQILALKRLSAFQNLGRFPASLFLPDGRAQRWLMGVRALDMQRAGYSREEMAQALLGESLHSTRSDWVLSRLRRLLGTAKHIADIGYFGILTGGSTKIQENPLGWPRDGNAALLPFPAPRGEYR